MSDKRELRTKRWDILSKGLGVLLLVTATLKLTAAWRGHSTFLLPDPRQLMGLALTELTIGIWLTVGVYGSCAWLAAIGFFAGALLASSWMTLYGVTSCPCFGKAELPPALTLTIDFVVVGSLLYVRPIPRVCSARQIVVSGMLLFFSFMPLGISYVLGSVSPIRALASLRGDHLHLEPLVLSLGKQQASVWRWENITIANNGSQRFSIIGGTSDSGGVNFGGLPADVPGNGEVQIRVGIRFPSGRACFVRRYFLFTDDPVQPFLVGYARGCSG
ncbi:MAG: hypothetical protein KatS3mg110_4283 [Pirellulaceae bacterium]|nr:MAG: hypothetical protein KatS3mg110_4283 [Pirellulaceae bacterium]